MQSPLTLQEVEQFVNENKYKISPQKIVTSRCMDGRYEKMNDLAPLAKPGADIGDLIMLFSTNQQYNLEVKSEKLVEILIDLLGGWDHFKGECFFDCGFVYQALRNFEAFGLKEEDTIFLKTILEEHIKKTGKSLVKGEHLERAILIIKGNAYSMYPKNKTNPPVTEVFVYHKTLDNQRRAALAQALLPQIKIPNITIDYLYEIMSQVSDDQFLEYVARLPQKLPMFNVIFEGEEFLIEEI